LSLGESDVRMTSATPMDPLKPYSFNHANAAINGLEYHYIDQRPSKASSKPPVVLVHGFPDVTPPPLEDAAYHESFGTAGATKSPPSSKQAIESSSPLRRATVDPNPLVPTNITLSNALQQISLPSCPN